jgi:PAS domain S-box
MKSPLIQNPNNVLVGTDSAILGILPFPAFIFDLATFMVLRSNSFFFNECDCTSLQLLKKYNFNFLDDDDLRKISKSLFSGQSFATHKIYEIEDEIRTYEVHAYLLPDHKNAFMYMNLLSNHKLTDISFDILGGWWQGLEVIDSKYRILLNQLPFGVYRTNVKGEFLYVNQALARMLGYDSPEELYKVNVSEIFVDKEDRIRLLEQWKKSIINTDEIKLKTRDSRIIFAKDTALGVLNKSGEIDHFDGILEDITSGVLLKQELMQARDKAMEADRLKISFLTNMSHEIRTPMNSILGFSSMLKRKGIPHQKRDQYLDIIISRSKHLMEVLNDILDMTRIEEKQVTIEPKPFLLNTFLEELYQYFLGEVTASCKPIKLVLNTALPIQDSCVMLDSHHLQKIFVHLLNNALKFTNEGIIEFGYTIDPEHRLVFYVKDTGIGVPFELQEAIFDRFRQADESFTREHGGLGLGLSICKGLINLMQGRIWVESDAKSGSSFNFILSEEIGETFKEGEVIVDEMEPLQEHKRVLIVEDDPASFDYLNEILLSAGCQVLHAKNGIGGLELFTSTNAIDLILLDIQLPEMDGYQFAQKIREIDSNVPIIAQTAHAMPEDRKKCLEAGCSCYLTKPIHYDLLVETIKEYLG